MSAFVVAVVVVVVAFYHQPTSGLRHRWHLFCIKTRATLAIVCAQAVNICRPNFGKRNDNEGDNESKNTIETAIDKGHCRRATPYEKNPIALGNAHIYARFDTKLQDIS